MEAKYLIPTIAGLTLGLGGAYALDQPRQAENAFQDTKSAVVRTVDGVDVGNLGDVIGDAWNDVLNRNPSDAAQQFSRVNTGYSGPGSGATPLGDRRLKGAMYKNSTNMWDWVNEKTDDRPWPYLGGGLAGLLALGALGRKKK